MKKELTIIAILLIVRLLLEPGIGFFLPLMLNLEQTKQLENNELFWLFYPSVLNCLIGLIALLLLKNSLLKGLGVSLTLLVFLLCLIDLPVGLLFFAVSGVVRKINPGLMKGELKEGM